MRNTIGTCVVDPDPHRFGKPNPDPTLDPHQSRKKLWVSSGGAKAQNGAADGL